jgi:hypothetical protein
MDSNKTCKHVVHNFCHIHKCTYLLVPRPWNITPKIMAIEVLNTSRMALYGVFLQYDLCCFHRQALH